jgi:hypothetical protein
MAAANSKEYRAAVASVQQAEGEHLGAVGVNTGGAHEARVAPSVGAGREVMLTAGQNSGGYENRASQHI